jgi:predicted nucleotidyltransferase
VKETTKSIIPPHLNYYEEKFVLEIIEKVNTFSPDVKKIMLYGSKARGVFVEESDIDLLLIMKGPVTKKKSHKFMT